MTGGATYQTGFIYSFCADTNYLKNLETGASVSSPSNTLQWSGLNPSGIKATSESSSPVWSGVMLSGGSYSSTNMVQWPSMTTLPPTLIEAEDKSPLTDYYALLDENVV